MSTSSFTVAPYWEMNCTGTEMSVGGVTSVSNPALPKLQVWECLKIRSNHGRPEKCLPTQFHRSSANLVPNFWDITDLQTAAWPQRHQPPYQQCPKNPNQLPRAQWYQSPQIQQVSSFPAFRHQLLQITRFPTTPPRLASICASGALPVQLLGVDSNKPKTRWNGNKCTVNFLQLRHSQSPQKEDSCESQTVGWRIELLLFRSCNPKVPARLSVLRFQMHVVGNPKFSARLTITCTVFDVLVKLTVHVLPWQACMPLKSQIEYRQSQWQCNANKHHQTPYDWIIVNTTFHIPPVPSMQCKPVQNVPKCL